VLGLTFALGGSELVQLLLAHRFIHTLGRALELADWSFAAFGGEVSVALGGTAVKSTGQAGAEPN
jgi:hypothetical protein